MRKVILSLLSFLAMPFINFLHADVKGRVEADSIALFLRLKEPGNARHLSMAGARFDANLLPFSDCGFLIRPAFNIAGGNGTFWSTTLSAGYYLPLEYFTSSCNWIILLPNTGVGYSRLHNHTDVRVPFQGGLITFANQLEKFHAKSYFLGLEGIFKLSSCFYVTLQYQYAWARTHTTIGSLFRSSGHSSGSSVACIVDYFLSDSWALSAACLYNKSLDKDRFGIIGLAYKLGIGYYF